MTLDYAIRLLRASKQIKDHLKAAEEIVRLALLDKQVVPGFKLGKKKTFRCWREDLEPDKVVEALIVGGFISCDKEDLFTKPKLISGPQAEKFVEKNKREAFNDIFLVRPIGEPTVIPDDNL